MKKAFTLFELVLSIVLFGLILGLFSKPLSEFYRVNFKALDNYEEIIELNFLILKVQSILQNCVDIKFSNNNITCFLKDEFIGLEDEPFILNSGLILSKNGDSYSPNSDLKAQLENRKFLFDDNDGILYALKDSKLEKIFVSNDKINVDFNGTFTPLLAEVKIGLENDKLSLILKPKFEDKTSQVGILAQNISLFNIKNETLKICIKTNCLEKRLIL